MAIKHGNTKERLSLADILARASELGLLDKIKANSKTTADDRLRDSFEEISLFIDKHKHPPSKESTDLTERALASRLEGFISRHQNNTELQALDRHSVLKKNKEVKAPRKEVKSIDDILNFDALGLLKTSDSDIFNLKHVPSVEASEREAPDEIAKQTECKDFYEFETLFARAQKRIREGTVEIIPFKQGSQINQGDFFILRGMLCFVDEVREFIGQEGEPYNPRLRVIFENATESNLLLRSLAAALYKDEHGRRLLASSDDVVNLFNNITHKDKRTGYVYIVASLSDNPALKPFQNLYKIGYTERTVEERVADALNDTAFLESPVRIVASYECFNLNPNRFETLIHAFLHAQRLSVELYSKKGGKYKPNEWFSVPLDTAREVVKSIIDGTIINYRMDNTTGKLIKK